MGDKKLTIQDNLLGATVETDVSVALWKLKGWQNLFSFIQHTCCQSTARLSLASFYLHVHLIWLQARTNSPPLIVTNEDIR